MKEKSEIDIYKDNLFDEYLKTLNNEAIDIMRFVDFLVLKMYEADVPVVK